MGLFTNLMIYLASLTISIDNKNLSFFYAYQSLPETILEALLETPSETLLEIHFNQIDKLMCRENRINYGYVEWTWS